MKWLKYIWILLLIYLVCAARTCNEDEEAAATREEQQVERLIESIEMAFTTETLTDSILRAYETTARDKLYDFADYLKIASDTSLDLKFRKQAAESIRNLFIPGQIKLLNWSKYYHAKGQNSLDLLIEQSLSGGISGWIQPSQIKIKYPFNMLNDSIYKGGISFNPVYFPVKQIKESEKGSAEFNIDVFLIRENKSFGDKKLRIWEVYFGNLE
ncbi:MAG: hypothetical protein MUF36_05385 [Bacteroidales bacterium]|jgi:hypothetical protein|nr:hypothetical protein [Bacteroidales bacterium]